MATRRQRNERRRRRQRASRPGARATPADVDEVVEDESPLDDDRTPREKLLDRLAIMCVIAQPVALLLFWGVSYFTTVHTGALAGFGLAGTAFLSFVAITIIGKFYEGASHYASVAVMVGSVTAGLGLGLIDWALGLIAGLLLFVAGIMAASRTARN